MKPKKIGFVEPAPYTFVVYMKNPIDLNDKRLQYLRTGTATGQWSGTVFANSPDYICLTPTGTSNAPTTEDVEAGFVYSNFTGASSTFTSDGLTFSRKIFTGTDGQSTLTLTVSGTGAGSYPETIGDIYVAPKESPTELCLGKKYETLSAYLKCKIKKERVPNTTPPRVRYTVYFNKGSLLKAVCAKKQKCGGHENYPDTNGTNSNCSLDRLPTEFNKWSKEFVVNVKSTKRTDLDPVDCTTAANCRDKVYQVSIPITVGQTISWEVTETGNTISACENNSPIQLETAKVSTAGEAGVVDSTTAPGNNSADNNPTADERQEISYSLCECLSAASAEGNDSAGTKIADCFEQSLQESDFGSGFDSGLRSVLKERLYCNLI